MVRSLSAMVAIVINRLFYKMENNTKPSFKDSLKSWDTENLLDRIFYRPLGYKIALFLKPTGITPNAITIFSIFVGVGGCLLFYPDDALYINMMGFALLVFANILDCVDGQLARITGIKSEIGRILDGFCGDLWFLTFYTVITLRLINSEGWGWWTALIALASAVSHLTQAGMVDYYKTLHLHFLKSGRNSEFESSESIKSKYQAMGWNTPVPKILMKLYQLYTMSQEMFKPNLKKMMKDLSVSYPDGYPDNVVAGFREKSLRIMPLLDSFTFNARSIVMLITLLTNLEWLYFAVEILILNPLHIIAVIKHEKMCKSLSE